MEDSKVEVLCNHLISSAALFKDNHISSLLKCHILTHSVAAARFKIKLPSNINDSATACPYCCTPWSKDKFIYKIKNKPTTSARRRYKAIIKNKNGARKASEIKNARLKLYGKKVELKCLFCKHKTDIYIKNKNLNHPHNGDILNQNKTQNSEEKFNNDKKSNENNMQRQKQFKKKIINVNPEHLSVYSSTNDIIEKIKQKPIEPKKKRHKDKFAGLCKAVLQRKPIINNTPKNNPLNLLLKPT